MARRQELTFEEERQQFQKYGERYCEAYNNASTHRCMLKDQVRTMAYHDAMVRNPYLFKNKIVMDIGCGTGILSMFALKAGAKLVIAIECSGLAKQAQEIFQLNGFGDKVFLINDKVENINSLPNGFTKVDIIVSEFMGFSFFFETMMESVIYARDKWLIKDGLLFPDNFKIYMVGISDRSFKEEVFDPWTNYSTKEVSPKLPPLPARWDPRIEFDAYDPKPMPRAWCPKSDPGNVNYIVNYSSMRNGLMRRPQLYRVDPACIVTDTYKLFDLDLNTITHEEAQSFETKYTFKVEDFRGEINGMVIYFDSIFPKQTHQRISIPTGPLHRKTHWSQAVYMLKKRMKVDSFLDSMIEGEIKFTKSKRWARDWDIQLTMKYENEEDNYVYDETQNYVSFHG